MVLMLMPRTDQWGHEFHIFRFMWKWHNKRKSACEMFRQITFFRVSLVPKKWSVIFSVSNAWTNMWNKMMEKKRGLRGRIPRKDLKRMSMPAVWRSFRVFSSFCPSVFKGGLPTFKACLSSDRSKSEKQKSWTCHWGSLAQVAFLRHCQTEIVGWAGRSWWTHYQECYGDHINSCYPSNSSTSGGDINWKQLIPSSSQKKLDQVR